MKLLVVCQYFYPEGFIINDVVRVLHEQGHGVTVLTGKPNYPDGVMFPGYRAGGLMFERYLDRIPVIRVPVIPRRQGRALQLILNYLSFVLSGLFLGPWALRGQSFDHILVFSLSPPTMVIPAIFLHWLKGCPMTTWVQDLWPESLSDTGFVRSPLLLSLIGGLMRGLYGPPRHLLISSRAFEGPISRYADPAKLVYFPNLLDTRGMPADAGAMTLPESLASALDAPFTVVFAGNIGVAQGLDTLIEAVELLCDEVGLRIVVIGSGSRLEWMIEQKQRRRLDQLVLPGRFSPGLMPAVFQQASVLLVSLKQGSVFRHTVPSKIQSYMAAGRPILAALEGEGARMVQEAQAGVSCPPEDAKALAEAVRGLRRLPQSRLEEMGESGRRYFDAHFEMRPQLTRLVELLTEGTS